MLLAARLFFAVGSALAAAAPSMNAFILGKAITGIGGSGTYLSVINIFTALTAAEERARCFSYIGFMWGLGTMSVHRPFFDTSISVTLCSVSAPSLEALLPSLPLAGVGAFISI